MLTDFRALIEGLPKLGPLPPPPGSGLDRGPLVRTPATEADRRSAVQTPSPQADQSFSSVLGRQLPVAKKDPAEGLDSVTQRQLAKAAREMEALFLRMLLKDLRRPLGKSGEGLFDQSFQTQLQGDMMFEQLADTLAAGRGGPLGIGDLVYEVLAADMRRQAEGMEPADK